MYLLLSEVGGMLRECGVEHVISLNCWAVSQGRAGQPGQGRAGQSRSRGG